MKWCSMRIKDAWSETGMENYLGMIISEVLLEKGQATHSRALGLPWWLRW